MFLLPFMEVMAAWKKRVLNFSGHMKFSIAAYNIPFSFGQVWKVSKIWDSHRTAIHCVLLLNINNDKAQDSNESKSLQTKKPEHTPEEHDNYWFHNPFSKIHPCKANPDEAFVELTKESPHFFIVVHHRFSTSVPFILLDLQSVEKNRVTV